MADKRITQLDAALNSDIGVTAVFETEQPGLGAPESRKITALQLQQIASRLGDYTAILAAAVSATAFFPSWDAANGDITTNARKLTLAQMRLLMANRATQATMHTERAKVGATAGWVVGGANNLGTMATLPAAQAGSTLVIAVSGLKVGQTITDCNLVGSLQSVGANCTITFDLRKLTVIAGGNTDASVGAMAAPLTVVANTILSSANANKSGMAEVVTAGATYYLLVTSTTAAVTTQELEGFLLTVTEA